MTFRNCFTNTSRPGNGEQRRGRAGARRRYATFTLVYRSRLKKFDPDNDDESLSNLETQCDDKDELQLHRGSSPPTGSVEYMESGVKEADAAAAPASGA